MICLKCNTQNEDRNEYCINCGNYIGNVQSNNIGNNQNMNLNQMGQVDTPSMMQANTMQNQNNVINGNISQAPNKVANENISSNNINSNTSIAFSKYFSLMIEIILKPFTTFKEEINKFTNIKNSGFLSLFIAILATIINLIVVMINTIYVKSYSFSGSSSKIVLENLKNINYIEVIGKNFLIYFGITIGIACVYYIGSLIIKKETNFAKLLGISALSIVPYFMASLVLAPILSLIYAPLGMIITIVGGVYTIIIIYELMNQEIELESNMKYYFNLICLSIILSAIYFVCFQTIMGGMEDLFDLLEY